MNPASTVVTHPDFRSAFCARYRCQPESFERKVFWIGLHRRAAVPVFFGGGSRHHRFHQDLEVIRSIGESGTLDELNRCLDELWSMQELDRDLLRRYMGFRVSTAKLQRIFLPLVPWVKAPPEPEWTSRAPVPVPSVARVQPGEGSAQRLRRGMRIHGAVTTGRPLEEVLAEEQVTLRELGEILSEFAQMRPEIGWLQGYLREREELDRLRSEWRELRGVELRGFN
jgi:hypothetical protein